jgi:hypothetical protein
MSAPSIETVQSWQGRTMVDPAGDKLGTIATIYLDDEAELYRHYGLDYSEHRSDSGLPAGTADDRADVDRDTVGRDTSGPTTDEAMTRSEEELRVEREPITDANLEAATSGPEISEAEHEVTLREETPVVEKTRVPRERVRLGTETVTDTGAGAAGLPAAPARLSTRMKEQRNGS